MSRARLMGLLGAAVGLGVLRWWGPAGSDDAQQAIEVVTAVERLPQLRVSSSGLAPSSAAGVVAGQDLPGNAFAVRVPVMPPEPPPPPPAPIEKPFVGPPTPPPYVPPPPPPPPPLQVVGTWDDGQAPGVFVASPQGGTVLARVGTVLMAEYTVTAITPQHIVVTHTASRLEWRLPILRAGSHSR